MLSILNITANIHIISTIYSVRTFRNVKTKGIVCTVKKHAHRDAGRVSKYRC